MTEKIRSAENVTDVSFFVVLMQRTLAQAVDMHQFIRCQIVRGIHCSTQHAEYHHCSTSRRGEEPSAVVRVVLLLEPHGGASVLLFF